MDLQDRRGTHQESGPSGDSRRLRRQVGVFAATMMGLGSILGTGIFVSVGLAAEAAGPSVILAITAAALVATSNGLSSAQLSANHPVSGGTYEYGYRWLNPSLGFTAGWMFLCAKSASAATAALGMAGYVVQVAPNFPGGQVPLALLVVLGLTTLVLVGIRRSSQANVIIVSITIASLVGFVALTAPEAARSGKINLTPFFAPVQGGAPWVGWLEATALMFVAYTGYGRVATLGEEIRDPRRNIPRAIIWTLFASMLLYLAVGATAVAAVGSEFLAGATRDQAAPLEVVAGHVAGPNAALFVSLGAITAMVGVLLNLILGLSRVVLAMGRRRDLPGFLAHVNDRGDTPGPAVVLVGLIIGVLTLSGSVRLTWSFSAFTVLVYYALTNLAAIRLAPEERLFPSWIPWTGLLACGFLAFWVSPFIWMTGCGLIALGLAWQKLAQRRRAR